MEERVLAGRYRLIEPIGKGTSATVWRAADEHMGLEVAVKLLHPQYGKEPRRAERFEREARALAALGDPAIVKVYDFGCDGDSYFIVEELVEGTTLSARLAEQGRLSEQECRLIGAAVARALAASHAKGIVHRDMKPHNVLLADDGRVCVTDFGIARVVSQAGLTQTGTVLGTARYISPEQAKGDTASEQSDLYALGTVLYEMATGEPPFTGEDAISVAQKHVWEDARPPRVLNPELTEAYERIVMRCLAKSPTERFATAREAAAALEGGLMPEPLPTPQRRLRDRAAAVGRPPTWVPGAVLATLLILVGAVIGGALARNPEVDEFRPRPVPELKQPPGFVVMRPLSVRDHDPEGDGQEHPEDAAYTLDNDAETFWRTDRYESEALGNLKSGVGLVYDFGRAVRPARATVVVIGSGISMEIRGSNDGQTWRTLARGERVGRRSDFDLPGARYRYAMVWITRLSEDPDGYRARVAEVTFARRDTL